MLAMLPVILKNSNGGILANNTELVDILDFKEVREIFKFLIART